MKQYLVLILTAVVCTAFSAATLAADKPVGITGSLMSVDVTHQGKKVKIQRNQNNKNMVVEAFAKTSRPCPPFCIQPISLHPGVETLGEVEVLGYVQKMEAGDRNIMLVDSRTPDWVARGTIAGAKNIPWTSLNPAKGATTDGIIKILTGEFNVKLAGGADAFAVDEAIVAGDTSKVFNFSGAKTLVMFCNGMWCGQSPNNIANLLKFGYPPAKIKWYRGGMQAWEILGFSTVKP